MPILNIRAKTTNTVGMWTRNDKYRSGCSHLAMAINGGGGEEGEMRAAILQLENARREMSGKDWVDVPFETVVKMTLLRMFMVGIIRESTMHSVIHFFNNPHISDEVRVSAIVNSYEEHIRAYSHPIREQISDMDAIVVPPIEEYISLTGSEEIPSFAETLRIRQPNHTFKIVKHKKQRRRDRIM